MKNKCNIVLEVYCDTCFGWKFLIKEINIVLLCALLLPVLALSLLFSLISSTIAATILFVAIIIHYLIIYFLVSEITGEYINVIKCNQYIIDLFLISKSKYWTKQRFHKFIYLTKVKCDTDNLNVLDELSKTKEIVKKSIDISDKKEKISSAPRRSLTLWLLAPVIGIFTTFFQEISKPTLQHSIQFYYVIIASYIFVLVVYVFNEIFNSEYNDEYKKLELLSFLECAEIYFQTSNDINDTIQIDNTAI